MSHIDTEKLSAHLRAKGINLVDKTILITNYSGSLQESDLSEPANCSGFGRIRHFRLDTNSDWNIINPLPILPAAKALGIDPKSEIKAQVFQNAVCNWRCWYCFVDFKLLSGNPKFSDFLSSDQMLELYLDQPTPPLVIDLSGGQPDLTPEWIPWMMEALINKGMDKKIYLWSDDNLSNDYFWKYLSSEQIDLISNYKMYGRVCCFKGVDQESFSLNTEAAPELFDLQFELFDRLLNIGVDLYAYITLTCKRETNFKSVIPRLMDRLQNISKNLPLRIVPLKVYEFSPVTPRMKGIHRNLLEGQNFAFQVWEEELNRRFTMGELKIPITDVVL